MEKLDLTKKVAELSVAELLAVMKEHLLPDNNSPPLPQEKKPKLLNVQQAAELLGYEVSTIYDKTHRRLLPFLKKGSKLWFREEDLIGWTESGRKSTIEELSQRSHLKKKKS